MALRCSLHAVGASLSRGLGKLGHGIGLHPCFSLLVPLAITLVLSTGLQNLRYIDDAEFLFAPRNGQSKRERSLVDEHFPTNQSGKFSVTRLTRLCRMGRLIAVARDGGTVLRQEVFAEIAAVDRAVQALSVPKDATDGVSEEHGETVTYRDICAHWQGHCVDNAVLAFNKSMRRIESGAKILHYPITFDVDTFKVVVLPAHLGGIRRNSTSGTILSAAVVSLGYFVRAASPAEDAVGGSWERRFVALVKELSATSVSGGVGSPLRHINLTYFTSETLQKEMETNFENGTPYVAVSLALMLLFSGLSCMSSDPVRSKGWLGMAGVMCTCVGVLAAFGLLIYCGVEFTGINFAVPFLALGIGIDDTFVMISCWRQTDVRQSVPLRLQETLSRAGISITITSATDFVSFWIGIITPFEAIRIFCIYIATCVLFVYLVHITMFAACIAYAGFAEQENRHGLFCFKIKPEPNSGVMRGLHKMLCITDADRAAGDNHANGETELQQRWTTDKTFHGMAIAEIKQSDDSTVAKIDRSSKRRHTLDRNLEFELVGQPEPSKVGDFLARMLCNFWVKIGVLLVFASYLGVAVWGLTNLRDGLDILNLCRYDSDAVHYYEQESKYFKQYRVQIVVNGNIDYSNRTVQLGLEHMLESFENNTYIADKMLTESWLRYFLNFVHQSGATFATKESFVDQVRKFITGNQYELDVRFSKDGKSIEATRYLIQTEDVQDARQGTHMMEELRELARQSPFNITIFNPYFVYFDQFVLVRPYTAQCVAVAAVVMLTVAVVFLPSLDASLCIALAMVSIEVGVVGFMALWGIKLDAIAMINLIMCIGFSVDFSAHVTHAYINAPIADDPGGDNAGSSCIQRMRHAYITAGMPIFQGMASTVLSLIPLALIPSYIARAFFKITFLVTVLGGLHAIFLLPVLLSLIGTKRRGCCISRCRNVKDQPRLSIRHSSSDTVTTTRALHPSATTNRSSSNQTSDGRHQTSVAISTNLESYVGGGGGSGNGSGNSTNSVTSNEITVHIRNEKKPITVKISHQLISSAETTPDEEEEDVGLGTSAGEDSSASSLSTPRREARGLKPPAAGVDHVTHDKATQTVDKTADKPDVRTAGNRRRLSSSNNSNNNAAGSEQINHGYDTDIEDCD